MFIITPCSWLTRLASDGLGEGKVELEEEEL
jgi:hypothetical protein